MRSFMVLAVTLVLWAWSEPGHAQQKDHAKAAYQKAEELYEAEDLAEAAPYYRKLIFGKTRYASKAKKRLNAVTKTLCENHMSAYEEKKESAPDESIAALVAAYRVDPTNKLVRSALKEHGYTYHQGAYRTVAEVDEYKKSDSLRGETRRQELGLSEEYRIIRGGAFRFFHNIAGGKTKVQLMTTTVNTHYRKYLEVMNAFQLRYPSEGLDVVFFRTEEEYVAKTQSQGSVGVYIPSRGASYFYLTGQGDDFNTLMHEMTHQLNDKVLAVGVLPGCLEEGLAEYFGAGRLKSSNKKVQLGKANYQSANLKDAIFNRNGMTYIPFSRFLTVEDPEGDAFYPQSWGLVQFLMHGHRDGRLVLFDALNKSQEMWRASDASVLDFPELLPRYGLTSVKLEKAYLAHYGKK